MEFHVGGCISHFAIEDSKGGPARILLFVIEMMRLGLIGLIRFIGLRFLGYIGYTSYLNR